MNIVIFIQRQTTYDDNDKDIHEGVTKAAIIYNVRRIIYIYIYLTDTQCSHALTTKIYVIDAYLILLFCLAKAFM